MMMRKATLTAIFVPLFLSFFLVIPAMAEGLTPDLEVLKGVGTGTSLGGTGAGFTHTTALDDQEKTALASAFFIASPVIYVLRMAYGFLGIILALIFIRGGYMWLTAQGNEDKVQKARQIIQQAVIGFALLVGSVIVVYFVMLMLGQVDADFLSSPNKTLQ